MTSQHTSSTLPVDADRLGETDDAYADTTLDGQLFSGVAYERDAEGHLISLCGYVDGKMHGAFRVWTPSGTIVSEYYYVGGGLHGPYREWDASGRLRLDAYYEYSHSTRRKTFAADGSVLEDEPIDPESPNAARIARARKRRSGELVDIDLKTWSFSQKPAGWGADGAGLPDAAALAVPAFRSDLVV
ncbi:MAG TPA: hypothetical protein VMG12_24630 [Polyangiaceae bacterium]|nr:hypothetical protein [Polyangiaceae bacterium]